MANLAVRNEKPVQIAPVLDIPEPVQRIRDLLRWNPFREVAHFMPNELTTFVPAFEVRESKERFIFVADLPGIQETELEITLAGYRLVIAGARKVEKVEEAETFFTAERAYGTFQRSFTLPEGVGTRLEMKHSAAVPERNAEEHVPTHPTCETPFERGGAMCRFCSALPPVSGLRLCSRIVAESPAMRDLAGRAASVARTDASVVIVGENGSGKEVLARAIHANGARRKGPFRSVNVAAQPVDALDGVQDADGGSFFIDEVSEMPLRLQGSLLRLMQTGEVGDTHPIRVNTRILCATHRDLRKDVAEGRFREDLFYRLKVFTLEMPPLRERGDDILPLAELFLRQEGHPTGRFTMAAEQALRSYRWPGNVRELQNAVKHGAALASNGDVDLGHLPSELLKPAPGHEPGILRPLALVEREHILRVLQACGGRHTEAARVLGIGRTTLWRKLQEYGFDLARNGHAA